jgi:hypothetical protein
VDPITGAILLAMLVASGATFAGKSMWDNSRKGYKVAKAARVKGAVKASGGKLTKAQARAVTRRHAAGYWSGEILKGFPVARTGWHAGWLAHRTAMRHHRHIREEARTTHLETEAQFAPALKEHARRQREAREQILAHVPPAAGKKAVREAVKGVILRPFGTAPQTAPEGASSGAPGDAPDPASAGAPDSAAGDAPATAPEDDGWPTGVPRKRKAAQRDSSWLRPGEKRCPECGGTGADATGDSNCWYCRGWGSADPDPDAPEMAAGTICEACGRPGTEDDPVLTDGVSNYHRSHAVEAYVRRRDAAMASDPEQPDEQALMADDSDDGDRYAEEAADIRRSFEFELCEVCGRDLDKHTIAPDALGHAHSYCMNGNGQSRAPLDLVPDHPASPATGGTDMSETTFSTVIESAKGSAASAEGNLAAISAERARYEAMADEMASLEVDSGNLSNVMDIIDGLRTAEQAMAGIQDTASALPAALERDHGQLDEAHRDAPVRAASRGFYAEGDG